MSTTISALSAATTLGGTEPIPCVQTGATVKTTPQALANFTLNTALGALSDIGTLLTTDQFYGVRSGAAYSVLASDITTFIQAQVWIAGNTPVKTSAVLGDMMFMWRSGTGSIQMTVDNLATYVTTGVAAATLNLSTLSAVTTFASTDIFLTCPSTTGKGITAANFETQVFTDFAAYVNGTLGAQATSTATDKLYCTVSGTPKYVTPSVLATYCFKTGMGSAQSTLQTLTGKATPIAADSIMVLDSTNSNAPALTTLAQLVSNYLSTYATVTASQTSGQSNATQLSARTNWIGTSAATGYVKLPNPTTGLQVTVINGTSQSIQLYGYASDTINGTAGATGITLTTGKSITLTTNGTLWIGQAAS